MKHFVALFLISALLFSLTACNKDKSDASKTTAVSETESVDEENETYTISVCGLSLKYPLKWKDKVTVKTTENRASFACGETKLFDLTFNIDEGNILGTVEKDEYTVIRVVDYTIEGGDNELYEMQEDMNVILQNLMTDYTFVAGEALTKEDTSTFDIKTSVVTMKYPNKWKNKVQIDVSEKGVKFSNDGTPLFDLMFSECDGYLLGTYKDTPIYIVDHDVKNDEQAAMQEDVNVILQYLMKDNNFVINQ